MLLSRNQRGEDGKEWLAVFEGFCAKKSVWVDGSPFSAQVRWKPLPEQEVFHTALLLILKISSNTPPKLVGNSFSVAHGAVGPLQLPLLVPLCSIP